MRHESRPGAAVSEVATRIGGGGAERDVLVGIAIVILAGLYTLHRERVCGVYSLQAPGRSLR
jgi:hypothetical protein